MLIANKHATHSEYPAELRDVMSVEKAEESRRWLSTWEGLNPGATPLYSLPGLAKKLGVAEILVKDESVRSPLGSFKALGAPIALARLILRLHAAENIEPKALFAGAYADRLADFTVISATDGNHGKGLAAAAQSIGCRCVIVLHANVSKEREAAIAAYGAEIVNITGNYDESVEEAARLAAQNGWHVVSDTSYEGYEEIPRDVMQGYSTIAAEIDEVLTKRGHSFTHVFLQGGVGGMAAGLISYFWEAKDAQRPISIVVEPKQADCLLQSALLGAAACATGSVDSIMAGLACGETSPLAWRFLQPAGDYFMTIADDDATDAMRVLARGSNLDVPIVSGESGAAGLAGLIKLGANPPLAALAKLDSTSRILIVSTEGATAPALYRELVGESANEVVARQEQFDSQKERQRA